MEDNDAGRVLNDVIQALGKLDGDARHRVIVAAVSFYGLRVAETNFTRPQVNETVVREQYPPRPDFGADNSPSPKQFLMQKQPKTDIERIACLAYYLTHFREQPHFKTLELAKLNTEAAQPKFSNTAYAATNAVNAGYLASASNGLRQLSAAGEQFVQAMPDREAAKSIMSNIRLRKPSKGAKKKKTK